MRTEIETLNIQPVVHTAALHAENKKKYFTQRRSDAKKKKKKKNNQESWSW